MGILFCRQEEGISSLGFVCHGRHNHQETSSLLEEAILHIQKDAEDQNIDREHHLISNEQVKYQLQKNETHVTSIYEPSVI